MAYNHDSAQEKIENKQFELVKDLTVLAATVFGMSIALAVGKEGNLRFIFGEFLLFLSVCSGVIILYSSLRSMEFFHFLMTSWDLKSRLPKKTGGSEDFIVDEQEKLIKEYDKLTDKSKSGILSPLLSVIKIDYFYPIFLVTFLLGTFLILLSLIDFNSFMKINRSSERRSHSIYKLKNEYYKNHC